MPFPLDKVWIQAAEKELGKRIPDSYRDRLMRDNGGSIDAANDSWELYPIYDQSDRKRIKRTFNHVLVETKSAKSWRGFPQDGLAIADNGSGDKLVLLTDKQTGDSFDSMVYLWSHETTQMEPIGDFDKLVS